MKQKLIIALGIMLAVLTSINMKDEFVADKPVSVEVKTVKAASIFDGVSGLIDETLNDGTEYSVYLAYPQKSSEVYVYNSQKWRSASMIKVFILACVMEQYKNGDIDIDEIMTLKSSDKVGGAGILAGYSTGSQLSLREILKLMITESDNTATNMVIDRVGMSAINGYIQHNGYYDTILQRKMMDMDAIYEGRENYSSVNDLGSIFVKIYNHDCVGGEYDEVMINFLKGQTDTDCFPAALPDKVIAHKTGALSGLYDDGGIIYDLNDSSKDAVLVIMTENFTAEYTAIAHMKRFAAAVVE